MSGFQQRSGTPRRKVEPVQGEMRRSEGLDYAEVAGLPPGHLLFRCSRFSATLTSHACAKRHLESQGPAGAVGERLEACRSCRHGFAHAGGGSRARQSILCGALALTCCRCGKGSVKIVRGTWCPSCANRHYEAVKGVNAKGTKPVKTQIAERAVWFYDANGQTREHVSMTMDIGESLMTVMKQNPGAQVWAILENGEPVDDFDADGFRRGKYSHLRWREVAGERVLVEIDQEEIKPTKVAAGSGKRLAEAAAAATVEAAAAPFNPEIAEKGARPRFSESDLEEIDAIIRAMCASGRTRITDSVWALNAAGITMPSGKPFDANMGVNSFVGRRMVHLGLREDGGAKGAMAFAEKMRPIVDALMSEGVTTYAGLVARMNEAGHRSKLGRAWTIDSVRTLLSRLGIDRDGAPDLAAAA